MSVFAAWIDASGATGRLYSASTLGLPDWMPIVIETRPVSFRSRISSRRVVRRVISASAVVASTG
jgi:hypothetical protein